MTSKRKTELPHGRGCPRPLITKHYECAQEWAYRESGGKRIRTLMLLDSDSNIFLLKRKACWPVWTTLRSTHKSDGYLWSGWRRWVIRAKDVFSHCYVGNQKWTSVHKSAEIVVAGHRDLVILFRWWYKEHPVSNLEHLGKWEFK